MPTNSTTRNRISNPSPRDARKAERDKKKTSSEVMKKKRKPKNLGFDNTSRPPIGNGNSIAIINSHTDDRLNNSIPMGHQNNNSSVSHSNFNSTGERKHNDPENRDKSSSESKDSSESKSTSSESDDDHHMDDNYRNNTNNGGESDEDLSHDELVDDDFDCVGKKKPKSQKPIVNNFPSLIIGNAAPATRENNKQLQDKRVSLGSSTLSSRYSHVSRNKSVSETQTAADTRKIEEHMLSKKDTLYKNLSENEILRIGWYVRDNLFRRVKIVAETMMKDIIIDVCRVEKINEIEWIDKYNDLSHCVKLNLNYRRAYVTKKIRNLLRGKPNISGGLWWIGVHCNSYGQHNHL